MPVRAVASIPQCPCVLTLILPQLWEMPTTLKTAACLWPGAPSLDSWCEPIATCSSTTAAVCLLLCELWDKPD